MPVLLVEQDPRMGQMLNRLLGTEYVLVCVANAAAALEAVREDGPFHAIVEDIGQEPRSTLHEALAGDPQMGDRLFFIAGPSRAKAHASVDPSGNVRIGEPFDIVELRRTLHSLD
jgi:hypothetical protein